MHEELARYAPDFPPENWTEQDQFLLAPFATNPDGFVSVLHNLPPEIIGALCSRTCRVSGSLLRVFLNEYVYPILNGDNPELATELERTVEFLQTHGFRNILNNQRAQALYAKWLSLFGDDSIAQLTGTHVVFWGTSQVAMKYMEDQRIGLEPLEKSTRIVNFGQRVGGKYLYYVPKPDLERLNLYAAYCIKMDHLFDTYVALVPELIVWLKANFNEKDWVLEKKAFDTLRGLLPMATLGQVVFRGNAQAFEYLINRTAAHSLGEFRWIAHVLKIELDKEIPSLLLRLEEEKSLQYQQCLANRIPATRRFLKTTRPSLFRETSLRPVVNLIDWDGENKVLAGILFAASCASWGDCYFAAQRMSIPKKKEIIEKYLSGRTARWQKVGKAFENSYVRFEILMDIGAYRDLHRHRMLTQERQLFTVRHGYDVPEEIIAAGLETRYREALDAVIPLFEQLAADSPELAQYVVPLAYRVRFYQLENLRECFWEIELRTGPQGHPSYRRVEQEKFRQLRRVYPLIAEFMLVDMGDYPFARRGIDEAIQKKEEELIKRLGKK